MIGFKNYVEQRDLVEAMDWYEIGVVEKEHIPKIQSAFEVLKSISKETKETLVDFYRSVKMIESDLLKKPDMAPLLKTKLGFHEKLKEKLKTELVNELKFNEIKIITSIPKIEEYMKELIKKSNKEDKEPDAKRFVRGDKGFK